MITLIDNYDSFTYNLVQYLGDVGAACKVIRNNEKSVIEILSEKPSAVVLSPGPCSPSEAGICIEMVLACAENDIPLFGVCLGFQSIAQAFGGNIVRGPEPMHGKISEITHTGQSVFAGLPDRFNVTRYHSLIAERASFPETLTVTAQTDDGIIMGLRHRKKPIHGVLFHPESIATEYGHEMIGNFVKGVS